MNKTRQKYIRSSTFFLVFKRIVDRVGRTHESNKKKRFLGLSVKGEVQNLCYQRSWMIFSTHPTSPKKAVV